jgi:hypothetical protein
MRTCINTIHCALAHRASNRVADAVPFNRDVMWGILPVPLTASARPKTESSRCSRKCAACSEPAGEQGDNFRLARAQLEIGSSLCSMCVCVASALESNLLFSIHSMSLTPSEYCCTCHSAASVRLQPACHVKCMPTMTATANSCILPNRDWCNSSYSPHWCDAPTTHTAAAAAARARAPVVQTKHAAALPSTQPSTSRMHTQRHAAPASEA